MKDGLVAQWLEQSTHNALVGGSSPSEPTISPCADWMLNSYAKHAQTTQEDIDWYFKQKELTKNKNRIN